MLRIGLYLATNLAVLLVFSIICQIFGIDAYLMQNGINYVQLLIFAALFGFGGSFISLLMSKSMAKRSMGVQIISQAQTADEKWLVNTIEHFAQQAKIGMPEVGIYNGAPNAFATGASKNNSLVAVSTGLLQAMDKEEVEAVLGHEISHIANGDMVTMTLLQGVLNTFVIFFSKVAGAFVDSLLRGKNSSNRGTGPGYFIVSMVCQVLLGILASLITAWFSRYREFRADAGSAKLMGQADSMIKSLHKLQQLSSAELPGAVKGFGIAGGIGSLMASHPPLEKRIAALAAGGYAR